MIDSNLFHIFYTNLSRVILDLEVWELRSLYVYIYILCVVIF